MAAIDDMVWETSATTGTGPYDLTTVVRSFNAAFGTGGTDTFNVYIYNADVTTEWLYGSGHLSDATTLVIDTIDDSSNGGSAVNFSAGTKNVTCDAKAAEIVRIAATQTLTNKTLTAPVINGNTTGSSFAGCLATQSSATTVSASTWTAIEFNTEAYDDLNWHDTAVFNSRITVDADGRFKIVGNVKLASTASGVMIIAIAVNGNRVAEDIREFSVGITGHAGTIETDLALSSGNYVALHVYQTGAASTTTNTSMTRLSVHRMGR